MEGRIGFQKAVQYYDQFKLKSLLFVWAFSFVIKSQSIVLYLHYKPTHIIIENAWMLYLVHFSKRNVMFYG